MLAIALPSARAADPFVNFESGQVRPLALSPDGSLLFATNTPANRLTVFAATAAGLARITDVPVGLEPVAIAVRQNGTGTLDVWVVNHLSDSVSIVRVDPAAPARATVMGTLQVGDEPRDIVFAGSGRSRAFVTTARRGQNLPAGLGPEFDTPGVGRALVWAFDADDPFADTAYDVDASPSPAAGEPLSVIELFGDSPRALAVSPDGSRVYAAIFLSGNQTTIVGGPAVRDGRPPAAPAGFPILSGQFSTDRAGRTPRSGIRRLARRAGARLGPLLILLPAGRRCLHDRCRRRPAGAHPECDRGRRRHCSVCDGGPPHGWHAVRRQHRGPERNPFRAPDRRHPRPAGSLRGQPDHGDIADGRRSGRQRRTQPTRRPYPTDRTGERGGREPRAADRDRLLRRWPASVCHCLRIRTDRDPGFCRARRRGRQSDDSSRSVVDPPGWPSTSSARPPLRAQSLRPDHRRGGGRRPSRRRRASPRPSAWVSTRRRRP